MSSYRPNRHAKYSRACALRRRFSLVVPLTRQKTGPASNRFVGFRDDHPVLGLNRKLPATLFEGLIQRLVKRVRHLVALAVDVKQVELAFTERDDGESYRRRDRIRVIQPHAVRIVGEAGEIGVFDRARRDMAW
jgi:hypothetical protein